MLSLVLGIILGIFLTLLGLSFSIYYGLNLISRSSQMNNTKPYVVSGKSQEQLDAELNFKPLKRENTISRKTWVRIQYRDPKEEEPNPVFIQLKANMLFLFPNEESEICSGVCCLDQAQVDTEYKKSKNENPIWKPENGLILSCLTRDLIPGHQTMVLYFKSGKELEQWYYACKSSSTLSKTETIEQKKQQEYWTNLSAKLTNTSPQQNPDWISAIISRIFFHLYDDQNIVNLVLKKIRKKINRTPKPSYVSDITVPKIYFGPHLPIIKSVRLICISNEGAVEVEGEFEYNGGFKITIEVSFKISFPGSRVIFVPVTLTATIKKFCGKAHFHCDAPPANCFWIGFYQEPEIEMDIHTEIGENYKLIQIPRLASLIVNKIRQQILENMVLPDMEDFPFPKVDNPLRVLKPPLKKVESEPILKTGTKIAFIEEENPAPTDRKSVV